MYVVQKASANPNRVYAKRYDSTAAPGVYDTRRFVRWTPTAHTVAPGSLVRWDRPERGALRAFSGFHPMATHDSVVAVVIWRSGDNAAIEPVPEETEWPTEYVKAADLTPLTYDLTARDRPNLDCGVRVGDIVAGHRPQQPPAEAPKSSGTVKESNPKDALAVNKLPIHLWPDTATHVGTLALLHGATKYGRFNWRGADVRATVYHDALRRHLAAWLNREDSDEESGVEHLGHILACAAILVDAKASGNLVDDRPPAPRGRRYREHMDSLTQHVERLRAKE